MISPKVKLGSQYYEKQLSYLERKTINLLNINELSVHLTYY
jgi:hypothetical protein